MNNELPQIPIDDDRLWGYVPEDVRCMYDGEVVCVGEVKHCERNEYCLMFEAIIAETAAKILKESDGFGAISP